LIGELRALAPVGERRMGASPHANGGLLLRDLRLPDFRDYAIDVARPATTSSKATRVLGAFLRDVMRRNGDNFRVVGPEETTRGIGIWNWASSDDGGQPDVVLGCAGDVPTLEAVSAAALLREHVPELRVRVVNVVDLMRLQPETEHPHGLSDREYDALFTTDRPVIFAYHGYPWLIHRLTYRRAAHHNLHVRGYKEEGTTTTPFDMVMLNDLDRFHLVIDVIDRVPGVSERAAHPRQHMVDERLRHARTPGRWVRTCQTCATGPGRAATRAGPLPTSFGAAALEGAHRQRRLKLAEAAAARAGRRIAREHRTGSRGRNGGRRRVAGSAGRNARRRRSRSPHRPRGHALHRTGAA
jgi:phosphoketolase